MLKLDEVFMHKLGTIVAKDNGCIIDKTYQDETGYYLKKNGEWKKLTVEDVDSERLQKIKDAMKELDRLEKCKENGELPFKF